MRWSGGGALLCSVCISRSPHVTCHMYSLVTPAYTLGQSSSLSDAVIVVDMSSAVIGLLVTVAIVISI